MTLIKIVTENMKAFTQFCDEIPLEDVTPEDRELVGRVTAANAGLQRIMQLDEPPMAQRDRLVQWIKITQDVWDDMDLRVSMLRSSELAARNLLN